MLATLHRANRLLPMTNAIRALEPLRRYQWSLIPMRSRANSRGVCIKGWIAETEKELSKTESSLHASGGGVIMVVTITVTTTAE